jgi:hypothetical protein
VVDSVKSEVCKSRSIDFGNLGFAGNDDLSLDARESLGDNGDGRRLFVFAHDGCEGFVLLAYSSVEAFGPSGIFGRVSPDVQGFLWAWGSGCGCMWGGRWGGRVGLVSGLAMWFVVVCSGELLAYFLRFGSDVGDLAFVFTDSVCIGGLGGQQSLFHAFKPE